ncbi:MAG: ATP cone domain-containing protein, partial [Gammaproteobacteria bacterium]
MGQLREISSGKVSGAVEHPQSERPQSSELHGGIAPPGAQTAPPGVEIDDKLRHYKVIRRNGAVVAFDRSKITIALTKAFLEIAGSQGADSAGVRDMVEQTTDRVIDALLRRKPLAGNFHIEDIQDQAELALMRGAHHKVARAYVIYREKRAEIRRQKAREILPEQLHVVDAQGNRTPLDVHDLQEQIEDACRGFDDVDPAYLLGNVLGELYDGISEGEVYSALYMAARSLIEREPEYSEVSARLLLDCLRLEVFGRAVR